MDQRVRFARVAVVLLDEVSIPSASWVPGDGWQPGPLPLSLTRATAPEEQPSPPLVADAPARRTYFRPATAAILFGDDRITTRWWRRVDFGSQHAGLPYRIWALEILAVPGLTAEPHGVLLVHASIEISDSSPADVLACIHAIQPTGPLLQASDLHLGTSDERSPKGRPRRHRLTMLTLQTDEWPDLYDGMVGRDRPDGWLWAAASGTLAGPAPPPLRSNPPDPEQVGEHIDLGRVRLSGDWRALVLRDGTAFVGLRPDAGGAHGQWSSSSIDATTNGDFLDFGELYVRTLYTDALVLGVLQRKTLEVLDARALDAMAQPPSRRRMQQMDDDLGAFRSRFWWRVAAESGFGNQLLRCYQDQHQLPELLDQVNDDYSGYVQRVQTRSTAQMDRALALLAVVGLPLGTALGVAQILEPANADRADEWGLILFALFISLLLVTTLSLGFLAVNRVLDRRHFRQITPRTARRKQPRRTGN